MANSVTIRTTAPGAKDAAKDVRGLGDAFKKMGQEGVGVNDKMRILSAGMTQTGLKLTAGVTLPLVAAGAAAIKLAVDAEETEAKLNAAFTSMGASSWTSMEKLRSKAEELMSRTTFDDEAIKEAQAVLLTFGDVTGEAFDEGTEAALNMSTALGTDLQSATIMIGKALNDPVKGITAMTRAGIQFTEEQKGMIRTMVETGDKAGAQTVILAELERQFGGMAEAVAGTSKGQMTQALNELGEVGEDLGRILLPVVRDAAGHIRNLADMFQSLSPEMKSAIVTFAGLAAALGPVLIIGGKLIGIFSGTAGLIAKIVQMTSATIADTAATTANTSAKNANAKALLGVGAGAAAVGVGLVAVNEGLNMADEKLRLATEAAKAMTEEQREAAKSTETLGMKTGDLSGHFANFLTTIAPWHSAASTARELNDELNDSFEVTQEGLDAAGERWMGYARTVQTATGNMGGDLQDLAEDAEDAADAININFADELRELPDVISDTMDDLTYVMTHKWEIQARLASLAGALTGEELAAGLKSSDPMIRSQAERSRGILEAEWQKLTNKAFDYGVDAGRAYMHGLNGQIGGVKNPFKDPGRDPGHGGPGGRAMGGPVAGHGIYEVNERGEPEVLEAGGRNYLLMGRHSGNVKPMGGPSGGGLTPPPIAPKIDVHVHLSTREFVQHGRHHAVVQGSVGGF